MTEQESKQEATGAGVNAGASHASNQNTAEKTGHAPEQPAYAKNAAPAAPKRAEKPGAPVCEGCLRWQWFGRKCWVYWEGKRCCSQYEDDFGENKGGFRLIKQDELFHL